MQLLLAPQIIKRLKRELRRAGGRESGGLLMGEHVSEEVFHVVRYLGPARRWFPLLLYTQSKRS